MGQDFRLIDLDERVVEGLSKLSEGIWHISLHLHLLPGKEKYLKPMDEIRRDCFARFPPLHPLQTQSRLLTVLPLDVLRLIFESFGPPMLDMSAGVNATSFALTCQLLFEVGHPVLKLHQAEKKEITTGHRLIIAGAALWAQSPDYLPPGLEVDPSWNSRGKDIYSGTRSWPRYYRDLREAVDHSGLFVRMRNEADFSEYRAAVALHRLWTDPSRMFGTRRRPSLENPVLRNLTTKEYARGDALKEAQEDDDIKDLSYFAALNIGDLAAWRIIWSSDPTIGIKADDTLVRGPWAGHRFDIVDISQFKDLEGWKDVSEELIDEAAEIYWQNDFY